MAVSKQYTISEDFVAQTEGSRSADAGKLTQTIRSSDITVSLGVVVVSAEEDTCTIYFKSDLGSTNEDLLDSIIATHDGEPVSNDSPTEVVLSGTPKENDGRVNVVNAPMSHGMYSWWTGSGDLSPGEVPPEAGPVSGRGLGKKMNLIFTTGEGEEHISVVDFTSYVEIYDGEGVWEPVMYWGVEDRFWVYILIPPNQAVCTVVSGTGNADVVDTGMGFSMVVPAAGTGQYNIDYDEVSPLKVGAGNPMAYWSMDDFLEGTVAPAVGEGGSPAGSYALLYDMGWRVYVCNDMPMGSPRGVFLVDSDKSEPIHKNWKLAVKCVKNSKNGGNMGVWLKFFRPDTAEPDYPPTVQT